MNDKEDGMEDGTGGKGQGRRLSDAVSDETSALRAMVEEEQGKRSADYLARAVSGISPERQLDMWKFAHATRLNVGDPAIVGAIVVGAIERTTEAAGDALVEKVGTASARLSDDLRKVVDLSGSLLSTHANAAAASMEAASPLLEAVALSAREAAAAAERCEGAVRGVSTAYSEVAEAHVLAFRSKLTGSLAEMVQVASGTILERFGKAFTEKTDEHLEKTKRGQHEAVIDLRSAVKSETERLKPMLREAMLEAAADFEKTRSKADPWRGRKLAALVAAFVLSVGAAAGVGMARGHAAGHDQGKAEGLLEGERAGRRMAAEDSAAGAIQAEKARVAPLGVSLNAARREYVNAQGGMVCSLNVSQASNPLAYEAHRRSCQSIGVDIARPPV